MKRSKIRLPQQGWGSTVTKYSSNSPKVSVDDFTAGTKNIDTYLRGIITKRQGSIDYGQVGGTIKDQFEAIFSDGTHHMLVMGSGDLQYSSGSGTFNLVQSGYSAIGNMEFAFYADRVYFSNGIDAPQVYDRVASYGGVTYGVPKTRVMGCQPPVTAPTTALAVDSTAFQVPAGAHTYKVTFLYYGSEESNGGPVSSPAVTTDATHTSVSLTSIPTGAYGVTARKIYRDNGDGLWLFVGSIDDNTTTTYTDKASIGTTIVPSDNGLPRQYSLVMAHKDRIWGAGISGDPSELDFSDAGLPDVFPSANTITCNPSDPISGLVVYNDRPVVFNRNSFGQIFGSTSDTFRYAEVPGGIGCVDNRTIQVRTINGVPILIWLSAKGFYAFNGSTVDYISDDIEDQVRFNLQQANSVLGSNAQSTQSDYQSGTLSGGIDATLLPGSLTTKGQPLNGNPTNNPLESWDTQSEWEQNSSAAAIVTRLPSSANALAAPVQTSYTTADGVNSGFNVVDANTFELPSSADFTGETKAKTGTIGGPTLGGRWLNTDISFRQINEVAIAILPPRTAVINKVKMDLQYNAFSLNVVQRRYKVVLYTDSFGIPGSVVSTSGPFFFTTDGNGLANLGEVTVSLPVTGGQKYWLSTQLDAMYVGPGEFNPDFNGRFQSAGVATPEAWSGTSVAYAQKYNHPDGSIPWAILKEMSTGTVAGQISGYYVATSAAISSSATWTSPVYDSGLFPQAQSILTNYVAAVTNNHPGDTFTLTVDQADDNALLVGLVTQTITWSGSWPDISWAATKRYWRMKLSAGIVDNRNLTKVQVPVLRLPQTATWTSTPIDCSADVTSYDAITEIKTVPAGTSAVLTVATSPDDSTYTTFGPIGSAVVQRYVKLKYTLTTNTDRTETPVINSATFSYNLTSQWLSQAIDLGSAPEGWNVTQLSFAQNGAGITFEARSAATSGGLSAASWHTMTNGVFPAALPLNRWAQWRVIFTSSAGAVAVVDSLTLNWFVKLVNSVRAASLFHFRTYYVCLAEYNNPTNNLLLVFDPNNNWRVFRGLNAATFGFFFSEPYYGDAVDGKVKKLLGGLDDSGTPIELDVRTKAFDFGDMTKKKIIRQAFMVCENTGATFQVFYSTDQGQTFMPMLDAAGNTSWTLPEDSGITDKRLVPDWSDPSAVAGKTVMLKITENTGKQVAIQEIHLDAYIKEGDIING